VPSTILFPVLFFLQIVWFLTPGLYAALWLLKRKRVDALYVVPVAAICSCFIGYVAFWIYLTNHSLGVAYSYAILLLSCALLIRLIFNQRQRRTLQLFEIGIPLALWCLTAFFLTSLTFACRVTPVVSQSDQICYTHNTTFDNVLPQLFANNIYNGRPKLLMGDWQGSDRPPLQSGVILLESPLTESSNSSVMGYQLLAIFLQALWVPAIWVLAKRLGFSSKQSGIVLLLCLTSGFFVFNSIFVWPKLLAGALATIALCLLVLEKASVIRWCLAGAALGLSLLAHGGVIFALPPLLVLLVSKYYYPGTKILLSATAIALLLYVPWMSYQHFYDPPGNRLMKWSLAGDARVDDLSFGTDLKDGYSKAGLKGVVANKKSNLSTLAYSSDSKNTVYGQGNLGEIRDIELRFMLPALGLLNLGWIALCIPGFRKRIGKSKVNVTHLKVILGIAITSLILWALIMFGPGTTIVQSSSYLAVILLFTGLAGIVAVFPKTLLRSILGIKITYFVIVWIIAVYIHHFISRLYVVYALASLVALAITYYNVMLGRDS
jgi:hypothetical protein